MAFFLDCFARSVPPPPPPLSPARKFDPLTLKPGDFVLARDHGDDEWSLGTVRKLDAKMGVKVQLEGWGGSYYYDFICCQVPPENSSSVDVDEFCASIDLADGVAGYWGCGSPVVGKLGEQEEGVNQEANDAAVKKVYESAEGVLYRELFSRWSEDAGRQASERDKEKMRKDPNKLSGPAQKKKEEGGGFSRSRGALRRETKTEEEEEEEEEEEDELEDEDDAALADARSSEHTLTYGEILYPTFVVCVLDRVRAHGGLVGAKVFTDIGCGTAKPVFAAALVHPFVTCRGIEILPDLCRLANEIADVYRSNIQPKIGVDGDARRQCAIELVHADAFAKGCDWSDSDVVFANSTCFTDDLFKAFSAKVRLLKPGSVVATTTTRLWNAPWLECLEVGTLKEDWGKTSVYLHRRLAEGATDERKGKTPEECQADRDEFPSLYTEDYLAAAQKQPRSHIDSHDSDSGGGDGNDHDSADDDDFTGGGTSMGETEETRKERLF